jgi:acyl-CoA ligase (AMP-forming) (exosortase A-associated)
MRTNLHHLLEEQARVAGDRPALSHGDVTLDYSAAWEQAWRTGAALASLGVRRGDRVAVFLDKRPDTVTAMVGASAAGAVFVPVNPALMPAQVAYILQDCGVRVLVTSASRWAAVAEEAKGCAALEHVLVVDDAGAAPSHGQAAVHDLRALRETQLAPPSPSGAVDLDTAAVLYTSGSTGRPKGVVLSHRNLVVGAESVSHYLGNHPDDVILAALPLSFDAGLSQVTTAFACGAHVVLVDYLLPQDVVRLCARHRVTGLTCVPPLWIQLAAAEWPEEASSSLRYFANTGGRMPRSTLSRLREIFPQASPFLMYGLTEAFRSTFLDPAEVDRRPDSIGKAIPNAEILVVRPDGSRCDPGEEGELVHRGALVAQGYWGDPARTAERFRPAPGSQPDWRVPELAVWSGDRVVADDDGFLYFVGRTDDMIKTSGYRVSPTEIEEVAYDSGLVRDAVALGLPDEALGHRVVLVVSPAGGELDPSGLLAVMRRRLPRYMMPAEVVVRDQLPRGANGKFDRVLLRQELSGS